MALSKINPASLELNSQNKFSIGDYTNSSSGTFNGYLQVGNNLQLMSYAAGANTQTQLTSNAYYNGGYKAIAGSAGASKVYVGGDGAFAFAGSPVLTNAGDAISFVDTFGMGGLGQTVYLQGATSTGGTGIAFPATQNASSNPNTLDDYEEGTWTPIDASGASLSYTSSQGSYIKIGRQVIATFAVVYPSTGNGASAAVGGLPFNTESVNSAWGGFITVTNYGTPVTLYAGASSNAAVFRTYGNSNPTNANMSTALVRGTVVYTTTS